MVAPVPAATARPSEPLSGLVNRYVGWSFDGLEPGSSVNVPGRHMAIVIALGNRVPGDRPAAAIAGGLRVAPSRTSHDGCSIGVRVEVSPLAARAILGVPGGALSTAVPLAEWG